MRSRSGVFFSVLFPIMLLLIFASVFSGTGTSRFTLFVQNSDQLSEKARSGLSEAFLDALNQTGAFDLRTVPTDADARQFVQNQVGPFGDTFRLLIIPRGFSDDLLNGSLRTRLGVVVTTLQVFVAEAGPNLPPDQQANIEQGLQQLEQVQGLLPARNVTLVYVADPSNTGSSIVESIIDNVVRTFESRLLGVEPSVRVQPESVVERQFRGIDYYLPGLVGAFVMTNGVIGVTTNTTEFKRRGILKRFATTPLSRGEWVLSNVLSQTLLSFLLVGVMIAVAWAGFGLQAIPDALTLVLIVAGAVLFSGMGLVLAGVITDVEAATAAGNAVAFPMMFLSGSFWPLEIMPSYLQSVSRVLPLTYFSEGLRATLIFHHLPSALTNLAIVGALAVAFIVVGSVVTRWRER